MPSRTAEAVLWGRAGQRIVNLNDLRGEPDSLGRVSQPAASSVLPIARAMRGELPRGVATRASDYRGVDTLWVGRPVAGTDWWLVAKMDMDEVDAPARQRAGETILAALLAVAGMVLGMHALTQRRRVREAERAAQVDRAPSARCARARRTTARWCRCSAKASSSTTARIAWPAATPPRRACWARRSSTARRASSSWRRGGRCGRTARRCRGPNTRRAE